MEDMHSAIFDRTDQTQVNVRLELIQSVASIRLRQWESAFASLETATRDRKAAERSGYKEAIIVLKMQRMLMYLMLATPLLRPSTDEMLWDHYTPEFSQIIELAEKIIPPSATGEVDVKEQRRRREISLDSESILPLYFVAAKCRVREIRWKAIGLLRRSERQYVLCNSVLTAGVAERLVRIEEEGMEEVGDGKVEREKRVKYVEARFYFGERRARVTYNRQRQREGNVEDESIDEWVDW